MPAMKQQRSPLANRCRRIDDVCACLSAAPTLATYGRPMDGYSIQVSWGAMLCNCGADELVVCSQFCDVRCAQSISNATALADKA